MKTIALLILAAGRSSRMNGRDKCMEQIDDKPMLTVIVNRAQATGADIFVALPSSDHPRARLLKDMPVTQIYVPNAGDGLSTSLRTGIAALPEIIAGAMIIPADMPDLQTADFDLMITQFKNDASAPILRATTDNGIAGHPVILPRWLFAEIQTLTGDRGAASLLKSYSDRVRLVALEDQRAIIDLDTQENWDEWHKAQNK